MLKRLNPFRRKKAKRKAKKIVEDAKTESIKIKNDVEEEMKRLKRDAKNERLRCKNNSIINANQIIKAATKSAKSIRTNIEEELKGDMRRVEKLVPAPHVFGPPEIFDHRAYNRSFRMP